MRRGDFRLDLQLDVAPGEVVALLGPNGAGKSTALRILAGLIASTQGSVVVGGRTLADADAGLHLGPHQRRIGVVFQDYLLFPHLSVLDNVAFGPVARGQSKAQARRHAAPWLERLGIADLAGTGPGRSPVARVSGSPWRARSLWSRTCCCSTSHSPHWTRAPGCSSAASCAVTWPTSPARSWW